MAPASDLPDDIVDRFREKMVNFEDFVKFGAVCKSWEGSATRSTGSFTPWLMLATYDDDHQAFQKFFSLCSKTNYSLKISHTQGRKCWGSAFGWLVTIGFDLKIHLFNPFTKHQLYLPSQPTFRYQYNFDRPPKELRAVFVAKFVLSAAPTSDTCAVMAIYSQVRRIAFAKPGDQIWTYPTAPKKIASGYIDGIFYSGKFYAVHSLGFIVVFDPAMPHPILTDFSSRPESERSKWASRFYLVEMSGELHHVERAFASRAEPAPGDDIYSRVREFYLRTVLFIVHKYNFHTKRWTELSDLGDYALFLGCNTSFAVLASNYPDLRRNCIYFSDDHHDLHRNAYYDMGVYDYEKTTVEPICSGDGLLSEFSRPIFVMPSL